MKSVTITMKNDTAAEVLLYDIIGADPWFGGISAKDFRKQVKELKADTMDLRINSPGGDVTEAAAMLQALDEWKGTINVSIDGMAASAASVVAMAGDTIQVASNGLMMIHNPYAIVLGGSVDMRRMAELLDKVKGQIVSAYERHSKAGEKQISAWMDDETWFTGQEAVDAGLADSVSEPVRVAAMAGFKTTLEKFGFKHAPDLHNAVEWAETERRHNEAAALFQRICS